MTVRGTERSLLSGSHEILSMSQEQVYVPFCDFNGIAPTLPTLSLRIEATVPLLHSTTQIDRSVLVLISNSEDPLIKQKGSGEGLTSDSYICVTARCD